MSRRMIGARARAPARDLSVTPAPEDRRAASLPCAFGRAPRRPPIVVGDVVRGGFLSRISSGEQLPLLLLRPHLEKLHSLMRFARSRENRVGPPLRVVVQFDVSREAPVFGFLFGKLEHELAARGVHGRAAVLFRHCFRQIGEACHYRVRVPKTVQLRAPMVKSSRGGTGVLQHDGIAALRLKPGVALIRIDDLSLPIEILRADMQRLVDVAQKMRQQDDRDRFGDFPRSPPALRRARSSRRTWSSARHPIASGRSSHRHTAARLPRAHPCSGTSDVKGLRSPGRASADWRARSRSTAYRFSREV